ncbi:MAG: UrcA family protein [Steroidobacteraceae bacterium]
MLITKALKSNMQLLLALTAAVMASAPICSHADESANSVAVKYSSPSTAEGARHLYARIERAANYACGTSSMDMEVMMNAPGPCVHDAIGRAIRSAKNPNLAQVYIEKNGNDEAHKFGISSDVMTAQK